MISVMFLAVLIAMYVASSAILTRGQYGALHQSAEDRRAEEAARSGLEYAQARLEENPDWHGDGNGLVVNSPSLVVREERGNVVGLVSTSDGGKAQFRIRFNYQDGGAGGDAMPDPAADMLSDSPHVSVNNILESYRADFPMADGPNASCQGTLTGYPVPAFSAAIVCEGRVFEELAQANAQKPNPSVTHLQSSRVIEAFYRISDFEGEAPVQDAVGMAGGDVLMQLFDGADQGKSVSMTSFQGNGPARFRGRGDISAIDPTNNPSRIDGKDASLLMLPDKTLTAVLGSGVGRDAEDGSSDFYKLTWDQAGTTSAGAGKMKAGVYVYWATDQKLHYYDKNYEAYLVDIKANPTDPGSTTTALPSGMTFVKAGSPGPDGVTSDKYRFVVTKDIQVEPSTDKKVKDLTIMPRAGAKEDLGSTGSGIANQTLADALGINAGMKESEMVDALSATVSDSGDSLGQNGGPISQLLAQVAAHGTISFSGNGQAAIYGQVAFQGPGGPAGPGGQGRMAGGYMGGGDPDWSPPTGWLPPDQPVSVTWDGEDIIESTMSSEQILSALVSGKNIVLSGIQSPNLDILKPVGNGRYRLKQDAIERLVFGTQGGDLTELDLPNLSGGSIPAGSETLGPRDFEVTMAPETEAGVRFSAPGDVRIAADVKGSGASISARGDIRLVGVGFDLDAGSGEEGTDVSLYSTKNIVVSTLRKEGNGYQFSGLDLRGVLYSWGNIDLVMSDPGELQDNRQNVHLQGTMVAYGGEPGKDRPGAYGGDVTMRADQIDMVFDPGYLLGVSGPNGYKVTLAPLSQSFRQ